MPFDPTKPRSRDEVLLQSIVSGDSTPIGDPRDREEEFIKAISDSLSNILKDILFTSGSGEYSIIVKVPDHPGVASGYRSISIGYDTIASNNNSFAGGNTIPGNDPTTSSGEQSFAYGRSVKATGNGSASFGELSESTHVCAFSAGNTAKASGACSAAIGQKPEASATAAMAFGNYVSSTGRACTVVGQYNIPDANPVDSTHGAGARKYVFIVGTGTSATAKSNGFTVDWAGNAVAKTGIGAGSTVLTEQDLIALKALIS